MRLRPLRERRFSFFTRLEGDLSSFNLAEEGLEDEGNPASAASLEPSSRGSLSFFTPAGTGGGGKGGGALEAVVASSLFTGAGGSPTLLGAAGLTGLGTTPRDNSPKS